MKRNFIVICSMCFILSGCGKEAITGQNVATESQVIKNDATTSAEMTSYSESASATEEATTEYDETMIVLDGMVAGWADEKKSNLSNYEEVDISLGEYKTGILFTAKALVKDFTFYEMNLLSVNDEGKYSFDKKELYRKDELSPGESIVLNIEFYGDMTMYGVSYKDDGVEKTYTISQSGQDGSLVIE